MDWKKIISDLMRAGLTQKAISEKSGLSQPAISDLHTGKQRTVTWEVGETLRALHKVHCANLEAA